MDSRSKVSKPIQSFPFLTAGGEMGRLTREYYWGGTILGSPDQWPQSLRTTLSIILNSKFPMFLFWGKELIQFYNDAFRPSLGNDGKHPKALGQRGEECWPEIWPIIKPMIDQVLGGGEATFSEDQLIPIYRNRTLEDVYWTFSYMPVKNETGKVEAVLVVCTENTEKVRLHQRLEEHKDQLEFAIEAAELGTWDYNPATNEFIANKRGREWFGIYDDTEVQLGRAIDVIASHDQERVVNAIRLALTYESGGFYDIDYTIVNPETQHERFVRAKGRAWFDENKIAYRFNGTLQDVTIKRNGEEKLKESEAQFRNLANTIPQLAWMTNADGGIYWYNQRWYDYTGTTLNEMKGWGWQSVHHPDTVEDVISNFKKAIAEGKPYDQTFRLRSKEGEYRWYLTRAIPISDTNGHIQQWFGTNTDITEQMQTEEALKESETKFRSLAETLPLLVWMTDETGNGLYASKSWEEYSGYSPYEHHNWKKIVHLDDYVKMNDAWEKSMATGKLYHAELRLRNKLGEYRWHVVEGVAIKNVEDKITKWIGAFTDIEEQKLKEQKKDEFISIASHEMKTPLTTAKGYLDLLLDSLDEENETALLYAGKANMAVGRLNKLITELLDASKIQHGKLNYNISKFDFDMLLDETIENIQHGAKDHIIEKQGDIVHEIQGDRERIQQVMTNLLSNAIKYSPGKNKVNIKVEKMDSFIQVAVQDFGVGIPGQHLENLFEKYYRVKEHAQQFQGLGIGLYISHEIVVRHEGRMWVKSNVGEGSTFYFTLPL